MGKEMKYIIIYIGKRRGSLPSIDALTQKQEEEKEQIPVLHLSCPFPKHQYFFIALQLANQNCKNDSKLSTSVQSLLLANSFD